MLLENTNNNTSIKDYITTQKVMYRHNIMRPVWANLT